MVHPRVAECKHFSARDARDVHAQIRVADESEATVVAVRKV